MSHRLSSIAMLAFGFCLTITLFGCRTPSRPVETATAQQVATESPQTNSGITHCTDLVSFVSSVGRNVASVLHSQLELLSTAQSNDPDVGIAKARDLAVRCHQASLSAKEVLAACGGFSENPGVGEVRAWAESVDTLMTEMEKAATRAADHNKVAVLTRFVASPNSRKATEVLASVQKQASATALTCITGKWEWISLPSATPAR